MIAPSATPYPTLAALPTFVPVPVAPARPCRVATISLYSSLFRFAGLTFSTLPTIDLHDLRARSGRGPNSGLRSAGPLSLDDGQLSLISFTSFEKLACGFYTLVDLQGHASTGSARSAHGVIDLYGRTIRLRISRPTRGGYAVRLDLPSLHITHTYKNLQGVVDIRR